MLLINWFYFQYKLILRFLDICSLITQTNRKIQLQKVTCLTDLPDEILLIICEYLRPVDALRAFLSCDSSDRFHRLIVKYRTNINLSVLSYSDFRHMVDIILPQLNPSFLRLSSLHIPCLVNQFLSSQRRLPLMKLSSLELHGWPSISSSLISWLSNQSKLQLLKIRDRELDTSVDSDTLRDFLFIDGLPPSVESLYFTVSTGLVLHNQLKSSMTSQINYAFLQLDTLDDLQVLLSKGLLSNVSKLHIVVQHQRISLNLQESPVFLHNNLVQFALIENDNGITPEDLTYFILHMPILQKLHVYIDLTQLKSFARYSYYEDMLPRSIVEFYFFARFDISILDNLEIDIDDKNVHRFPMKIHDNMIYTVPWRWFSHSWAIPIDDHHPSIIHKTKSIYLIPGENRTDISMNILKPFYHATSIMTPVKVPSFELFRCLRTLKTGDATIVHSILPSTLRSLESTDTTPLDLNAPLSTLVHNQVNKLILRRPIRDQQDLLNVLHQFPNVRVLSFNLPSTNSKYYLFHILHNNNARLPRLICLHIYGGESVSWSETPFEWLIKYTPLKYRSTPFYTTYHFVTEQLIIWL